jgi:hypothetical protein
LRASYRRTDLAKWAAGTRRLYARAITVLLDVILGLPADDAAGVAETLAFLAREGLGPYDVFTLQVLPGTTTRREAAQYGMVFQEHPPYYVLATDRLPYGELRRLRRELKAAAGLDPNAVEGAPEPRSDVASMCTAEAQRPVVGLRDAGELSLVERVVLGAAAELEGLVGLAERLAAHVDVVAPLGHLATLAPVLAAWITANPSTMLDLYLLSGDEAPPAPVLLRAWREALPYTPGYLDRVAIYGAVTPAPPHVRVSPRLFLVLPWRAQADPADYVGVAQIVWRYDAHVGEALPLGAWRTAGGAGVWLTLDPATPPTDAAALLAEAHVWAEAEGRMLFSAVAC